MLISYQQWIAAIRRHLHLSILAFAAVMGLTVLVILFAPRSYTSEAKLLLRIGRESITVDPTASSVGDPLTMHHTRENEIQSAVGLMRSRQIVENVVDRIGEDVVLGGKPKGKTTSTGSRLGAMVSNTIGAAKGILGKIDPVPASEKAVRQLSEGVYIGSTSESSVVSVAYTTKSPEVAQDVVANWVDCFIDQHADANRTQGSFKFFADQGIVIREQLENARFALEEAKNESNLVTVDGQQKLLEAQLAKVRDALLDVDSELAAVSSRVDSYEDILNSNDAMITSAVTQKNSEAHDLMRSRLFELEVTEKDLKSKYHDDHPRLAAIRSQLNDAKQIVGKQTESRDEVTQSMNPAYQKVVENRLLAQTELQALSRKRVTLTIKRNALAEEISQLNRTERLVRTLESEVDILQSRYTDHAVKMEQSRLDDVLASERITSVNIVQPATLQLRPVSPDKPLCAVAGFLAAAALAISLPVLVEARNVQYSRPPITVESDDWEFEQRERLDPEHQRRSRLSDSEAEVLVTPVPQESVS